MSYGSSPSSLEYARLVVLGMFMVFVCIFTTRSGHAATITVTVSADDIIPNGNCTLREAILAANTNAAVDMCAAGEESSRDYIRFNETLDFVNITLSEVIISSDLDIVGAISIYADAPIIFRITEDPNVGMYNVGFYDAQAAVYIEDASVSIFDCFFSGNGRGIYGGDGYLEVHNSTFFGNFYGIEYKPTLGSILNEGTIEVHNSSFAFNNAAGLRISQADFLITGSTIHFNGVNENPNTDVGGVFTLRSKGTIVNSTISQNETIRPSLFGRGGGIVVELGGELEIRNSTVTLNRPSGIYRIRTSTVSIFSTIVADNEIDLFGEINSDGYNIVGNVSNSDTDFVPAIGDQVGTSNDPIDPGLESVADNGGETLTHSLKPGSPAIDTGRCLDLSTDQRGYSNPGSGFRAIDLAEYPNFSDGCDVGAYELDAVEVGIDHPEGQPNPVKGFMVSNSYPNPFSNTTSFTLTLRQPQHVRVELYDLIGRLVAVLYEGRLEAGNNHSFDINGQDLSNGLYFYRVVGENFSATRAAVRTE